MATETYLIKTVASHLWTYTTTACKTSDRLEDHIRFILRHERETAEKNQAVVDFFAKHTDINANLADLGIDKTREIMSMIRKEA